MVVWAMCYILTHSSSGATDNRRYEPYHCFIMKDSGDSVFVNCYEDFVKKHVKLNVNEVVQLINENECTYAK